MATHTIRDDKGKDTGLKWSDRDGDRADRQKVYREDSSGRTVKTDHVYDPTTGKFKK